MTRGLGYRTGSRRCSISTNFWDATTAVLDSRFRGNDGIARRNAAIKMRLP